VAGMVDAFRAQHNDNMSESNRIILSESIKHLQFLQFVIKQGKLRVQPYAATFKASEDTLNM